MKKVFFVLIVYLFLSFQSEAQLFYEPFQIEPSSLLSSNGWVIHSGGETNAIRTTSNLSFGELRSLGSAAQISSSGQDVHQSFSSVDRGSVFLSAWVNIVDATQDGGYFLHLGPNDLGSTFRARVFVKENNQGALQFGISKASNNPVYTSETYEKGKTYLLVAKYSFFNTSGTDDLVSLGVFEPKADLSNESFIATANTGESDAPDIGSVAIRQGSRDTAPSVIIDEIKVTKTWEEATALQMEPFVKIIVPNQLISYSNNCTVQPIYKATLSALGQSSNLNIWTADPNGLVFSENGEDWKSQISLFSENGSYNHDFYFQPKTNFEGGATIINIDDVDVNSVGAFTLDFEKKEVRDDCSLLIATYRELTDGFNGRITGVVTASSQEFGDFNYLQDETGAIRVNGNYDWSIGDSVSIAGIKGEVFDDVAIVEKACCGPSTEVFDYGTGSIEPKLARLENLDQYPGQLVTVEDATLSDPNFVFLPNTNEVIRQGNRAAQLRIWSTTELDGYAKNNESQSFTGVVGRFRDNIQLYPRIADDVPNLVPYKFPTPIAPKSETFDVAAWNVEWFGSEGNGPEDDEQQLVNATRVLEELDADAIVLTEIANLGNFNRLVSNLPGYEGTCSNAVSNGAESGNAQRVCMVYKSETVSLAGTRPLLGNTTFINDYPGGFDRFWASGRLPALFVCDVSINGVDRRLHIVGVHARANRNNDDERELVYNMRKKDIEILKDTLDTQFSAASVIVMGDYNDDLDETVVSGFTESTYKPFVNDRNNWNMVSKTLSDKGYKSFIGFENVIDHIGFSDELNESYISNSVFLDLPFTFIPNYTNTTSDHLPVVARFDLQQTVTSTELLEVDSILVYPNPTTGTLYIESGIEEGITAVLRNQRGLHLANVVGSKEKIEKKLSKILNKCSAGLYFLQLNIGYQTKSYKIVKQD